MSLASFAPPHNAGRRSRPTSWHGAARNVTPLVIDHARPGLAAEFRPTADQILQSRLNAVESQQMANAHSAPSSPSSKAVKFLQGLAAFAKQPLSPRSAHRRDQSSRRPRSTHLPSGPRQMALGQLSAPVRQAAPRPIIATSEPSAHQMLQIASDTREREIRLLGRKHEFSIDDLESMDAAAADYAHSIRGASPNALYAWQRQSGLVTEISEFHGFCHSTPLNIRICVSPVFEKNQDEQSKTMSRANLAKAFQKKSVQNRWSKICVGSHGLAYESPMIPFDRMLKLKFTNFLRAAESGDLLMEGSMFDESSRYVQHKTRSLTAHVAIVYKDPISSVLYALTSRKWSKPIKRLHQQYSSMADLQSSQLVHGVQMHPLEEYIYKQRRHGTYFIFRRLQKVHSRVTANERLAIGQGIFEWYLQHQGQKCPNVTEQRRRIKVGRQAATIDAGDECLLRNSTMSSSQAVVLALQHAGILSPNITAHQALYSSSGYFETRTISLAAVSGEYFKYDFLANIDSMEDYAPRGQAALTNRSMISNETGDV